MIGAIILVVVIGIILVNMARVVRQQDSYVIETLGKYSTTWNAGLHFMIPFIQRVAAKVSLKEQVADFPPQSAITKDNVMMSVNSVVYFTIFDPYKNVYGVENYLAALEKLSATTLRSIIGNMMLDETLSSREKINEEMRTILDTATDPWGIKVNRVEILDIVPPPQMQDAMEKQATAERLKRAAVLEAEGEKQSAILIAEGNKESTILNAEAEKARRVTEAEGQAQAIERVQQANANALKMLKEVGVDDNVLVLKKLEAMSDIANGTATKLVIPSDLMGVAGITEIVGSVAKDSVETTQE